jgi:hypothetical protein
MAEMRIAWGRVKSFLAAVNSLLHAMWLVVCQGAVDHVLG